MVWCGVMMRYMWMNREVWIKTTGDPVLPDPLGQNASLAQQETSV